MAHSPRIYQAERILRDTFDRYHAGAQIVIHGTNIIIPDECKFQELDELQKYVNDCLTDPALIAEYGVLPKVQVRARKGTTAAHYESDQSIIAIPLSVSWANRELVILHELAHHIQHHWHDKPKQQRKRIQHDQSFLEIYLELIGIRLGVQAKFLAWTIFMEGNIWKRRE